MELGKILLNRMLYLASIRGLRAANSPHQLELISCECNSLSSSLPRYGTVSGCSFPLGEAPSIVSAMERIMSNRQAYATEIPYPSGIEGGSVLSSISKL